MGYSPSHMPLSFALAIIQNVTGRQQLILFCVNGIIFNRFLITYLGLTRVR